MFADIICLFDDHYSLYSKLLSHAGVSTLMQVCGFVTDN